MFLGSCQLRNSTLLWIALALLLNVCMAILTLAASLMTRSVIVLAGRRSSSSCLSRVWGASGVWHPACRKSEICINLRILLAFCQIFIVNVISFNPSRASVLFHGLSYGLHNRHFLYCCHCVRIISIFQLFNPQSLHHFHYHAWCVLYVNIVEPSTYTSLRSFCPL